MEKSEKKLLREMICIMCPASCRLTVEKAGENGEYIICGNTCANGKNYALNEMTDPKRIVTAVVASDSKKVPCIPVKTDSPLKMPLIHELLQELFSMQLSVPVKCGDVVIKDYKNTGVNVLVTRNVEE